MKLEVLGIDYDNRIRNFMISARADYEWYLGKTQGSEENLAIQRDVIKGTKPYRNLRTDIKMGCILPTIVLAVRNIDASVTGNYNENDGFITASKVDLDSLQEAISQTTPADDGRARRKWAS
jgi:hypothetical protein